jgi:hypothetical protein
MAHIDEGELARMMEVLPDVLAREEMVLQRCLPQLAPADVLDAALKRSLARLRFELNQDSFEYLRWKVAMARAEHQRLTARARMLQDSSRTSSMQSRAIREDLGGMQRAFQPRTFTGEGGITWTVSTLNAPTPQDPQHSACLVFNSEAGVSCVWDYPANWRELSDDALDTLRKGH